MAITASTVSPFPNPSAEYIAGANRGNPQPANERRHITAAIAVSTQISKQQNTNVLRNEHTRRSVEGKGIDHIRLNTLKVEDDTRTNEHDALFGFRAKLESNQ